MGKSRQLAIMFLISCFIGLLVCFYSLNRSSRVFDFRVKVSQTCCDYDISDIPNKKIKDASLIYHNLPSYSDMTWSFKPLKLETYVDKKIVDELKRPYEDNLILLK